MICPAENLNDAKEIVKLAQSARGIWGLAGYYPGNAGELKKLREFLLKNKDRIVGIGEIGLDVYWLARQAKIEKEMFRRQMELAVELNLPVVIHNREAEGEIRAVMDSLDKLPRGQFHCWSGSDEFLDYVIERDYYVGFCGNVTYKKNEKLREQVKKVPRERLLVETDAPYLPPEGKRGERNTPMSVKITARLIAELREQSEEEIARQTTENAVRLFALEKEI